MAASDVLGVLASVEDIQSQNLSEQVFVNSMKALQYMIRPISELPEQWDKRLYTGYWSNGRYDFEDVEHEDEFSRRKSFVEWMKNKLVVFKPIYRAGYYKMEEIRIVPRPLKYTDKSTYTAIPVFSSKVHGISKDEFEERLLTKKFIARIDNISHDDTPEFIIWKENDGEYKIFGPFESHQYAHGGFAFTAKVLRKEVAFNEEWFDDIVTIPNTDNLMFIGVETQTEIISAIEAADKFEQEISPESVVTADATFGAEVVYEENLEEKFIECFISETRKNKFVYCAQDLVNFHTAMKVSNLVILAGMSGTGKSRLVEFYRKALRMPEERAAIIPVRSAWTDDADLIGYVDLLHMVYRPGDSGLVNTLIQASRERDQLFIICFDEMNLARVEHYFSQFLSLLEMDANRRYLKLYNEELETRLYNGGHNEGQYPPSIKIGENVMFVGTVNIDESTYHFSDKVLDRANVISLTVRSFADLKELSIEKKAEEDKNDPINTMSFNQYLEFKRKDSAILLSDLEIGLLKDLHLTLQQINRNMGVGFRVLNQIDLYLKNLPSLQYFSREEAFDKQVVQRILTKVRGSEDQLRSVLGKYKEDTDEVIESKLMMIFERYSEISSFSETKKIIQYKAKELKMYGYTM